MLLYDSSCISSLNCPPKTLKIGNQCLKCKSECLTCNIAINNCTTCISGKLFTLNTGTCTDLCEDGYYLVDNSCFPCNWPCKTCNGNSD